MSKLQKTIEDALWNHHERLEQEKSEKERQHILAFMEVHKANEMMEKRLYISRLTLTLSEKEIWQSKLIQQRNNILEGNKFLKVFTGYKKKLGSIDDLLDSVEQEIYNLRKSIDDARG